MKLNERLYEELGSLPYKEPAPGEDYVPVASTPVEVQQVGEHSVEVYYMNEYKDVLEEFTKQGKFAVWSSKDGKNYRLAVEKEYYEKLNELYTIPVNKEWLGFWDRCEKMQKNFSRKIVLPVTIVVIIIFIIIANIPNIENGVQLGLTIGIPLVYLVCMMFVRRRIINNIGKEQQQALANIKQYFGEAKFDKLLKDQRTYIDEYYDEHYETVDKETNADDADSNDQNNEETSKVEVIEESEPKSEE